MQSAWVLRWELHYNWMQNKKQFHLTTIQLDQHFNLTTKTNNPSCLLFDKRKQPSRCLQAHIKGKREIQLVRQDAREIDFRKLALKQNSIQQDFKHFQVNRQSLANFFTPKEMSSSMDISRLLPTRDNYARKSMPFQKIINSRALTEQSNRYEEEFNLKLTEILKGKPKFIVSTPTICKQSRKTESSIEISKKTAKITNRSRPKSVSMQRLTSTKKLTADRYKPTPWEIADADDNPFYVTDL